MAGDGTDLMRAKSYNYVRAAMVGVLLLLGLAVFRQTWQQDWTLLPSISAYYYSPAQGVFVASLVALGVCMIALQGTTRTEDVLLNLGGMLAPVVAFVPTSRGEDHERAVALCERAGAAAFGVDVPVDCPEVQGLQASAEANIANNVWALLVLGAIGLVAAAVLTGRARLAGQRSDDPSDDRHSAVYRVGYTVAVVLYVVAVVSFWGYRGAFIDGAHWVAAGGLFLCILAVVVSNALRRKRFERDPSAGPLAHGLSALVTGLTPKDWYSSIALAMLLSGAVLGGLALAGALTVFWVEAALIALFAVFWIRQTAERWNSREDGAGDGGATPPATTEPDPAALEGSGKR
jgi:hypothetical protein